MKVSKTALEEARKTLKKAPYTIFTRADRSRYIVRDTGIIEELSPLPRSTAAMSTDSPPMRPWDPSRLSIVTWNVWFDPIAQAQRYQALIKEIINQSPDIICLQEVTSNFLEILHSSALIQSEFISSPGPIYPYGCLILARKTLEPEFYDVPLPSRMGRTLVYCEILGPNGNDKSAVGTVHLESLNSRDTRAAQLKVCSEQLKPYSNAILCGDFNFDDTQEWGAWERVITQPLENHVLNEILHDYDDVWSYLHPNERGVTFDGSTNPVCIPEVKEIMRYDRILLKRGDWKAAAINMLGEQPLDATGIKASDHYGLYLECSVKTRSVLNQTTEL
ncbi:hypothetical protein THRCLA_02551 [Thraustotheca clavata]|uniref:Endonuclease/exonuclease/phosphatase domain-containing protein n=1 Tax=Thraustotheca clavata TaxID=74557 RepID=A0A1W0A540_9STRA|nr:hypothetical protein THRCLA_02551 [Thraustotheca clavata]